MSEKQENICGLRFGFSIPFAVTSDEAWDWADQQDVATIHDITVSEDNIIILPLWEDDFTKEVCVAFTESFYDHFAEKMQ